VLRLAPRVRGEAPCGNTTRERDDMRLRTTSRRPTLVLDQLLRMQASELCAMAREILAYVERAGDEPTAQAYACEQIRDALIEAATLAEQDREDERDQDAGPEDGE